MIAELSLDKTVEYISHGLNAMIRERVKTKVAEIADTVVEEVASEICDHLRSHLQSMRSDYDGRFLVTLVINGEKKSG